jgi:hypothetical protein
LRFGYEPFAFFEEEGRGEPGAIGPVPVGGLVFEVVEVTDSASEPRRAFDLCFAIQTQFTRQQNPGAGRGDLFDETVKFIVW